jgi:serine/threonine-protein kinase
MPSWFFPNSSFRMPDTPQSDAVVRKVDILAGKRRKPLGPIAMSALIAGLSSLSPAVSRADPTDSATAQALFDEAKTLLAAGKAKEACPKFEESQRLDPGSGTLLNLARCYEDTGRLALAWSKYIDAAIAAKATGNLERESVARERAALLAPRLSKLVVNVPAASRVQGLEIVRDGAVIGTAQWGLAIPLDVGEHTVEAKAPGYETWKSSVPVTGEGTTSQISVPALVRSETPSVPPPHPASAAGQSSEGLGTQKVVALVAGGVGVVGLAVGGVFGLKAVSNKKDADPYCSGGDCTDPRGVTAGNDAHAAGNAATVGLVVGAVGLAAGLTLWFTAPKEQPATQVGFGLGTVQVRGAW